MSPLVWAWFALAALVLILVTVIIIVRGPDTLRALLAPGVRRWLYALAAAVLVLLVGYGLLTDHLASLWGLVLAALFGVAHQNTPATIQQLDQAATLPATVDSAPPATPDPTPVVLPEVTDVPEGAGPGTGGA